MDLGSKTPQGVLDPKDTRLQEHTDPQGAGTPEHTVPRITGTQEHTVSAMSLCLPGN